MRKDRYPRRAWTLTGRWRRTLMLPTPGAQFMEPIQGDAGIIEPPMAFVEGLAEICRRHGPAWVEPVGGLPATTWAWSQIACAAASATIEVIAEEKLVERPLLWVDICARLEALREKYPVIGQHIQPMSVSRS